MTKHKRKSTSACKTSAKVIGNHVTMKATCPIKSKALKVSTPKKGCSKFTLFKMRKGRIQKISGYKNKKCLKK